MSHETTDLRTLPSNAELADQLEELAELLELNGENSFKVRAYTRAARAIQPLDVSVAEMLAQDEPLAIEGVGKGIEAALKEWVETGTLELHDQLLTAIPAGVLELTSIPGLGPRKVRFLWQEAGLTSPEAVYRACQQRELTAYKGFGEKTQQNLEKHLAEYLQNRSKLPMHRARKAADQVRSLLLEEGEAPVFARVEATGGVRRALPVVDQVVLLAEYADGVGEAEVANRLEALGFIRLDDARWQWTTAEQIPVFLELTRQFSRDWIRTSTPEGPLRARLETVLESAADYGSEEAIFTAAGLPYLPPEVRDHPQIIERIEEGAKPLPRLLEVTDLQGVLHAHSTWSDGRDTLEAMARACQEAGYGYLGITDHSRSAFYARGLKPKDIEGQHREIDALNQKLAPFRIFRGIESDILGDGRLDYDPLMLRSFDFIIASVHAHLNMTEARATERLIRAIQNPYTTMLGHPTGRLLLGRAGYPIDHRAVIDACAAYGVAIEINANPRRLDLDWQWIDYARAQGVWLAICPDAHSVAGIQDVTWGVAVARKGLLTAEGTLNCLTTEQFAEYLAARHPDGCQWS